MAKYNETGHTMCDLYECTSIATFCTISETGGGVFNLCVECYHDWATFVTVVTTLPTSSNLDY